MMNRTAEDGPVSIMAQSSGILHNSKQSEKCVLSEMTCANYAFGMILYMSSVIHFITRLLPHGKTAGVESGVGWRQTKGSSVSSQDQEVRGC